MEGTKKIVLLGQFGVGKTSLLRRFMTNVFEVDYKTTLGVQIKKKEITLPSGKKLSMIIWDLEGFSSVSNTRTSYLIGSDGFIYVFDLTRPVTYFNLREEIDYIEKNYPNVCLKIIGNKNDLKDSSSIEEYLANKNLKVHGFCSAKTGEGVEEIFRHIAFKIGSNE
ncbi:Rab family GTPase [Ulvibacter antarcticus]|uniref:Small GTP-binding protein n=1 Tax=Ulvibacter antarcticus TaxID=442714 RepID=A0A3L9YZY4_9FLAO|nr:Rab family GTPase [Ulvibacter antarcticus]RMA66186.1 small GTP-binding protein [Ulvibacter antarcticus]